MDHIAASVAPPKLMTSALGNTFLILSGSLNEIQSPLNNTNLKLLLINSMCELSNNKSMVEGIEFQIVIFSLIITLRTSDISLGSSICTKVAPVDRAPNISKTDKSKHIDDNAIILSLLFTENLLITSTIVFTTAL